MESQLKELRDNINSSKQRLTIEAELAHFENKKEFELMKMELKEESEKQVDKEIKKYKEILTQEFEYKMRLFE